MSVPLGFTAQEAKAEVPDDQESVAQKPSANVPMGASVGQSASNPAANVVAEVVSDVCRLCPT